MMKTAQVPDVAISQQIILDYQSNILLNLYAVNGKYAFRYLRAQHASEEVKDPLADSDNFNWGYGFYNSPEEAIAEARDYYLTYGIYKVFNNPAP